MVHVYIQTYIPWLHSHMKYYLNIYITIPVDNTEIPIPVDNTEMPKHSSASEIEPLCTHEQEEKQQTNNSVLQNLSEGDDTVSG